MGAPGAKKQLGCKEGLNLLAPESHSRSMTGDLVKIDSGTVFVDLVISGRRYRSRIGFKNLI